MQISQSNASCHNAWAKITSSGDALSLLEHSADVASVMLRILTRSAWRRKLAFTIDRDLTSAEIETLCALAFLHDLGKCNKAFWSRQFPGTPSVGHTRETAALFLCDALYQQDIPQKLHDIISTWGDAHFCAAMAHHGRPLQVYSADGKEARDHILTQHRWSDYWTKDDCYDPLNELSRLLQDAQKRFPLAFASPTSLPNSPLFVSLFCGLLTLADWLGSDTSLFPIPRKNGTENDTLRVKASSSAMKQRGLEPVYTPECDFITAFDVSSARSLQSAAGETGLGNITILEAETGSGKTEAALWRWLVLRRAGHIDGLYFALPTRSAAAQVHHRVQKMLERVFGRNAIEAVLAVPGYLRAGEAEGQALPDFKVMWNDSPNEANDSRWAAERPKRYLAARVAVGTIDQALMSALQLRHAHLRAAVLSRSLLVVDEVHASDTFQQTVIQQLLTNHTNLGGHAILLSATLTAQARAMLLNRQETLTLQEACKVSYPILSGNTGIEHTQAQNAQSQKKIHWNACPVINDSRNIALLAIEAAQKGASVLIIRNSVAGAIAVAQIIDNVAPSLAFRTKGVSTLHHGRFAPGDRRLLDQAVESAFGKGRSAQGRILCGTQTLEQSLDLDADLMITDLAPIDVLLQRIGRLHRHQRANRGPFERAQAIILTPEERDLTIFLGRMRERHGLGPGRDGAGVYPDLLVLEATLRLIENNANISIPDDNRRLVEGALHPDILNQLKDELGTAWVNHAAARDGAMIAERNQAKSWLLDLSKPFSSLMFPEHDEHIATRLGLKDRAITFNPPFPSPFGEPVTLLTIPGWMAGGLPAETSPEEVRTMEGMTTFSLGGKEFCYSRWGLIFMRKTT